MLSLVDQPARTIFLAGYCAIKKQAMFYVRGTWVPCLPPLTPICRSGKAASKVNLLSERFRAKRQLKWTAHGGLFHKIVFHWCYTLTSAEACIPELPPPPFQCFSIFNMTERTLVFSAEGVLWGSIPSLVPAQAGPPMPGKRLWFPENPCWEGEEFHLGWNAVQATDISSITQLSLAVKVFFF